ncbi:YejL family protein [Pseudoalteromonas sp. GB56]
MPALSKYKNEEVEQLVDQLIAVLANKNAPVDLSLMCLGNTITHIIKEHVPEAKRTSVAQNFANALTDSIK